MSWYVKYLILNSEIYKSLKENDYYYDEETSKPFFIVKEKMFDSDVVDDILTIEIKINDMLKNGFMGQKEKRVVELLKKGKTYRQAGKELKMSKDSVRNLFNNLCDKIAFSLGGIYTDSGFIEYMMKKYNLTEEDVPKLLKAMKNLI